MDNVIRDMQLKLLKVFGKVSKTFALSGGTTLELFYLKHRFSRDLDFFSTTFDLKEIDNIILKFSETIKKKIKLENEFMVSNKARVRFYTINNIKGTNLPLKIDFIEDVLFNKPNTKNFNGVPVYDIKNIYFQKIITLVGTHFKKDAIGRDIITGRQEVRDIVDIYYLSKRILPLRKFVNDLSMQYKRGIVQWYRTYSRQETKLGILDLQIYDKNFNISEMIMHIDNEIKEFIKEVAE